MFLAARLVAGKNVPCCITQTLHPNSWLVTSFRKADSPKTSKDSKQNDKNLYKSTIKGLKKGCSKKDHDFLSWMLSLKTPLSQLKTSSWSVVCHVRSISQKGRSEKTLNQIIKFNFVGTDKWTHITEFTTLKSALFNYQTILALVLHGGVWSCVWMCNSSKSTFIYLFLQDLELGHSRDLPSFLPLPTMNCQKS